MKIETIELKNFKIFKDVKIKHLPALCTFVGVNGSGKTTLFDVFGFLRDALLYNVRVALQKRGGFKEVVSRDQSGPIQIKLQFRQAPGQPKVTYELHIALKQKQPYVKREVLKYRRGSHGQPWHFLDFSNGKGNAISNESDFELQSETPKREEHELESNDTLAIKGLGQFQKHKAVSEFRKMIEDWHVSDFHISDARPSQEAGYAEHLSSRGENLALFAQYMYENHREQFDLALDRMARRVPGVKQVEATETADGRIVLRFHDGKFKDPFIAKYVSDGTIKMWAYLLLLHDPTPHPLLCVEEPENQLYHQLMQELAEEFREYSERGGQVFVSTHSPDFLNGVKLEEIFWMKKVDGFSQIVRASDQQDLVALSDEGDLPGALWKQKFFAGANL